MTGKPTIHVYVDGFNLFRQALHGTEFLWLDVTELSRLALPGYEVTRVKYFTALVKPSPHDLFIQQRQMMYLEVLKAQALVDVHLGYFRRDTVVMPLHPWSLDDEGEVVMVKVKQNREKGSDVNLATHLIWDALHGEADAYAVLTNDSDLVTPIRMLRDRRGVNVGVVFPSERGARLLQDCGAWTRHIHPGMLRRAQFPDRVILANGGSVERPREWPSAK